MIPDEVRDLLRFASGLDRWLRATDTESGQIMVAGWSELLAAVPAEVAYEVVRDHYARPDARTIQPGDIAEAWRQELRAEATTPPVRPVEPPVRAAGVMSGYLRRCLAVIASGGRVEDVPRPVSPPVSDAQLAWERRCAFPGICACSHTRCMGGWLDEEVVVIDSAGRSRHAVKRCPACADAILMAEERGLTRKPQHGQRRR